MAQVSSRLDALAYIISPLLPESLYCATNERSKTLFAREIATLFFSSLGDIGHGED